MLYRPEGSDTLTDEHSNLRGGFRQETMALVSDTAKLDAAATPTRGLACSRKLTPLAGILVFLVVWQIWRDRTSRCPPICCRRLPPSPVHSSIELPNCCATAG